MKKLLTYWGMIAHNKNKKAVNAENKNDPLTLPGNEVFDPQWL